MRDYTMGARRSAGIIGSACGDSPMPAETLKPRVDWLDDERRKDKAALGRLEEKLGAAEAALAAQTKQIQEVSAQVGRVYAKFQPGQIEELLSHHREDLQRTMESLEKRRLEAEEKGAKVRVAERESIERALGDMHRQLAGLTELQRPVESRRGGAGITHGHLYVNGRRLNRPSYLVQQGDRIAAKPAERSQKFLRQSLGEGAPPVQPWLQLDAQRLEATVAALPTREDVQIPVEEQLIIEMCSR